MSFKPESRVGQAIDLNFPPTISAKELQFAKDLSPVNNFKK
jgi:hypothetical protein